MAAVRFYLAFSGNRHTRPRHPRGVVVVRHLRAGAGVPSQEVTLAGLGSGRTEIPRGKTRPPSDPRAAWEAGDQGSGPRSPAFRVRPNLTQPPPTPGGAADGQRRTPAEARALLTARNHMPSPARRDPRLAIEEAELLADAHAEDPVLSERT
jgi:hypothetical protein